MTLPPDRGRVPTEGRHPESGDLDTLPVADCVELMIDDHREVTRAVAAASRPLTALIDALVERMRLGGRLVYLGAGTSGRLGVLDASECPPTFCSDPNQVIGVIAGGDAALRRSSEGLEDEAGGASGVLDELVIGPNDTVIGIAAGGTTPYVLGAITHAAGAGAMTALLTCSAEAVAPTGCDHVICLATGPEILTGSTRLKAGGATKLALNIITTVAFVRLGKTLGNLMIDLRATNDKLTDRAIRILCDLTDVGSREEAASMLDRAGGRLKTAIVMQRCDVTRDDAERLLATHGGFLRPVLEESAGLSAPFSPQG